MKQLLLMLALSTNILAANKIIKSDIAFTAVGKPAFIKANGHVPLKKSDLTMKKDLLSGSLTVSLAMLDSGIELRDTHLKEKYLHTVKHPIATLTFKGQKIMKSTSKQKVTGTLMFHGKEKEITIEALITKVDKVIKVQSDFDFLLTDYGVELPSFQGITAANKVKLKVNTEIML